MHFYSLENNTPVYSSLQEHKENILKTGRNYKVGVNKWTISDNKMTCRKFASMVKTPQITLGKFYNCLCNHSQCLE